LANAKALIFGADTIDADEALRIGLVNEVVPDAHLLQVANQWVDKIIACDGNTLSAAKEALNFGVGATMADAMSNEHTKNAALRAARAKQ
jgi:enoyl-CoA hydratase